MVWLLPVGFLVAGRFGPAAASSPPAAMLLTLAYFPHRYWDLVALDDGPDRDPGAARHALLIALLACAAGRARASPAGPSGRVLGRERTDPPRAEQAVSARYLID